VSGRHSRRGYLARHGARGRGEIGAGRALALALAPALVAGTVGLGALALTRHDPPPAPPAYGDERWQDPSGYPYCTIPDDGLRPCLAL
jgi:hypothetical protein